MSKSELSATTEPRPALICHRLSSNDQHRLLVQIVDILGEAPLYRPTLPRWGTPFSVLMSNCGSLGWFADKSGYRYRPDHPTTGQPWPPIPTLLHDLWRDHARYPLPPEACLINHYGPQAKMGLHQDKDEADLQAPVLSISLGDSATFKLGGLTRKDSTTSHPLHSGDVLILAGANRLAFHGVSRIYPGSSALLDQAPELFPAGGRLNLTLRRVSAP